MAFTKCSSCCWPAKNFSNATRNIPASKRIYKNGYGKRNVMLRKEGHRPKLSVHKTKPPKEISRKPLPLAHNPSKQRIHTSRRERKSSARISMLKQNKTKHTHLHLLQPKHPPQPVRYDRPANVRLPSAVPASKDSADGRLSAYYYCRYLWCYYYYYHYHHHHHPIPQECPQCFPALSGLEQEHLCVL